jgi:hypothetical protein
MVQIMQNLGQSYPRPLIICLTAPLGKKDINDVAKF